LNITKEKEKPDCSDENSDQL